MKRQYHRGEIYFADLGEAFGSEQGGRRPVIIVQNDVGNEYAPTVIVAPITSRAKTHLPTHLPLSNIAGIRAGSIALAEQLRTIDKGRLTKYIGSLPLVGLRLMDAALLKSLGLDRKAPQAPMLMTLCPGCSQDFRNNEEFSLRRVDPHQKDKERCTKCSAALGFDYLVSRV
jgi:mRNA interferase MazF